MVQATPLSIDIQEIDAYPLSFAEDEIETYRMQEQFSSVMQRNMIATYKIDFERGKFEDYTPTQAYSFPVEPGDDYENKLFISAGDLLDGGTRLQFIETFSIASLMQRYAEGKTDVVLDYESNRPDGQRIWLRSSVHLFTDIKGHLKGYMYVFDIDRQKRQELRLTRQAELDLATGVYNKETVRRKITQALSCCTSPAAGAFFMIDLDGFKQINDTYGHAVGDQVIRQTAEILRAVFGREGIIGRLGGDEFGVFCPGTGSRALLAEKARSICQRVRAIRPARAGEPGTSLSIGIAQRAAGEGFDRLYQKADQALYIQKTQRGRDGFTFDGQADDAGQEM